jgi:hypothetical protein
VFVLVAGTTAVLVMAKRIRSSRSNGSILHERIPNSFATFGMGIDPIQPFNEPALSSIEGFHRYAPFQSFNASQRFKFQHSVQGQTKR